MRLPRLVLPGPRRTRAAVDRSVALHVSGAFLLLGGSIVAATFAVLARRRERPSEIALFYGLIRVGEVAIYAGALLTIVIGLWLVLTVFGAYSAAQVSNRWLESFSIPGYSAYETNQRTLHTYGSGEQFPLVAVITAPGRDVTKVAGAAAAFKAAATRNPGGRYSDYFTTRDPMYVSKDRHATFAEIFPAGNQGFSTVSTEKPTRAALKRLQS